MKKTFLLTTGSMFALLAGLLWDILDQMREISTVEDILFRAIVLVLYVSYYFTGQAK